MGIIALWIDGDVDRLNALRQWAQAFNGATQLFEFARAHHLAMGEAKEDQHVALAEAAFVHRLAEVVYQFEATVDRCGLGPYGLCGSGAPAA